jgi:hypothetical protein
MLVMAAGTLAALYYVFNSGISATLVKVRRSDAVAGSSRESFLWNSLTHLGSAVAACLIVKLIDLMGFYAFIITVPILTIIYFTYKV